MSARVAPLPERPRRYRFSLTPLADAMFQLLIFFMLSSSLTPYSLVTLRGAPAGINDTEDTGAALPEVEDTNATTPASSGTDGPQTTVWKLGDGVVTVNGQIFETSQLRRLAKAIATQNAPARIVIMVTDLARVQDIAAAIEALDTADIESVQITRVRR